MKYRIVYVPLGAAHSRFLGIFPYYAHNAWYKVQVKRFGIWWTINDFCSETEARNLIELLKNPVPVKIIDVE